MEQGQPVGGKWTFDVENRKKYPKNKKPPTLHFSEQTKYHKEAKSYVSKFFKDNYGDLSSEITYPVDFEGAEIWFQQFLEFRFHDFGSFEDAIVKEESYLHHSLLSPLINIGLLNPKRIINDTISFATKENIPINSTEGFIRQILGWREFIRGVYEVKGTEERTKNFWKFTRKIPASFYNGTTGIEPVDDTIKKVLKTGYAHHSFIGL